MHQYGVPGALPRNVYPARETLTIPMPPIHAALLSDTDRAAASALPGAAPRAPLAPRALLALQLRARGYALGQIALLLALGDGDASVGDSVDTAAALEALYGAVTALKCRTADDAVTEARRRRLIL
jgi:hypothetical protein